MTLTVFHRSRLFCLLGSFFILCACSGGNDGGVIGGNNDDDNNPPPPPTVYACTGSGSVPVSGVALYEFVPAVPTATTGAKLDFASAAFRPIRGAEIQAICPDGSSTYDTDVTDAAGASSLVVPENVDVAIRVRAIMQQTGTPSWNMSVVDNTQNQAVWSAQGEAFDSATGSATVNLEVDSGWGSSSYTGARSAAPFAILDSAYIAMQKVLTADASAVFPPLKLNWSPKNTDNCSDDLSDYPFPGGCIGTSFFVNFGGSAGRNIFILGDDDNDTDEYDNHVIIHEWGHYYEDAFARSDSIGGAHGGGDALDLRVAFGEGWGNAWSGIATDDPAYVDTSGSAQSSGFVISVEDDRDGHVGEGLNPGWWNESSVQEIIYDLYDDTPGEDGVSLGFDAVHAVLTGAHRNTAAVTSIFPLIHFLIQSGSAAASDMDALLRAHDIAPITDEWGENRQVGELLSGEADDDGSEFGGAQYVTPIHRDLGTLQQGEMVNICTTNGLDPDSASERNRLGARRFLHFTVDLPGSWEIRLDGSNGGLAGSDPDFYVQLRGDIFAAGRDDSSGSGVETETVTLSVGQTYVIEVLDWLNVNDASDGGESCLALSFSRTL